jgi:hypothetical protein
MSQIKAEQAQLKMRLWGPASTVGAVTAATAFALDQAHKYWMLEVYRIADRGKVAITSFFDLVMAWNKGVSYGLFAQNSTTGRIVLIAISLAAVAGLMIWMANSLTRLASLSLGRSSAARWEISPTASCMARWPTSSISTMPDSPGTSST